METDSTQGQWKTFNSVKRSAPAPKNPRKMPRPATELHNRSLVIVLRESGCMFHTYLLQDDRVPIIVIRGLHPVTPIDETKNALAEKGYNALKTPAPDYSGVAVVNGDFEDVGLDKYAGKYLVILFYSYDFSKDGQEIIEFSERAFEFRQINCELLGVSNDSEYAHIAWTIKPRKDGGLGPVDLPLLSDKSGKVAKSFGVYREDVGTAWRSTFIVDDKNLVRQVIINDDKVVRSVDEILRLVEAIQMSDKFPDQCER